MSAALLTWRRVCLVREMGASWPIPRQRFGRPGRHDLGIGPVSVLETATRLYLLNHGRDGGGRLWGSDEVNVENWKPLTRLVGHQAGQSKRCRSTRSDRLTPYRRRRHCLEQGRYDARIDRTRQHGLDLGRSDFR